MPSIQDVAKHAGVSAATASRVLSEADYPVSAATRERVIDAARELDFVPNALARGLVKRRIPLVGVIVHDITDPYFAEIVRGVEDEASPAGYLVITCSSSRRAMREESYTRLLRSMRAAIVLFAGSGLDDPELNDALRKHQGAISTYGGAVVRLSPSVFGAPDVSVDNVRAVSSLVDALVGMGHRRIAFLGGPPDLYVARERLAGYVAGLRENGIAVDPALMVDSTFTREGGADAVDALLGRATDLTELACANDLTALGALQRLAARRIRVPEDVSVMGVDDISVAAQVAPSLSTVRIPLQELGKRGFVHASQLLSGRHPRRQILETEVILRGSTAPPAGDRRAAASAAERIAPG